MDENLGLGLGLAKFGENFVNAYQGSKQRKQDLERQAQQDAIAERLRKFEMFSKGVEETPEGGFSYTQEALTKKQQEEQDKELERAYKKAQTQKLLAETSNVGKVSPKEAEAQMLRLLQIKKLTEEMEQPKAPQALAAGYATRVRESGKKLEDLESEGYKPGFRDYAAGLLPKAVAPFVQTDKGQLADQSKRNFVNAVLRRESGAAISNQEFENAERQYFPAPGDTKDVLDQKARNRAQVIAALEAEAGPKALGSVRGLLTSQQANVPGASRGLVQEAPAKKMTAEDMQALEWAKSNPNTPEAKEILRVLGVQ